MREVLNDANGNLINLYRVVREHPDELKDRLLYVLHSREDFKIAQRRLAQFSYKDDILRAGGFLPDHPAELRRQWKTVLCCGPEYVGGVPRYRPGRRQAPGRHLGEGRFRRYLSKV